MPLFTVNLKSLSVSLSFKDIAAALFVIVKFPVEVIAPVTSRPASASTFLTKVTLAFSNFAIVWEFVVSTISKTPLLFCMWKSGFCCASTKSILGLLFVIVRSDVKLGEIFDPAIAALEFISAFTIVASAI